MTEQKQLTDEQFREEDASKYGSQLEDHPNWKGGRTVTSHGYVLLKMPDHPSADTRGYVYEHRVVAEENLGRRLRSDEHVHHINGDTQDNSWENLEVLHKSAHRTRHRGEDSDRVRQPGEENPTVECSCGCGETFKKYDDVGREREYAVGHAMKGKSRPSPTQDAIREFLEDGPQHREKIADHLGLAVSTVGPKLSRMDGVEPVGGAEWALAEEIDD